MFWGGVSDAAVPTGFGTGQRQSALGRKDSRPPNPVLFCVEIQSIGRATCEYDADGTSAQLFKAAKAVGIFRSGSASTFSGRAG